MGENGMTDDNIVVCRDVHKWFGSFHVLRGITTSVRKGEKVVILGPSGSGKSTFIRTINRLEEHQRGDIIVDGVELTDDVRNIEAIRQDVGMVFQSFNLFPHLTVMQNITLAPIKVRKWSRDQAEEVAETRRLEGGRLVVANLNAPGQVVMAGGASDLDWLQARGRSLGIRRMVRLPVAGAFHSGFMAPAARKVEEALVGLRSHPARFPVYANVSGEPMESARIAETLVTQVSSPVRFAESLSAMARQGVEVFVHVGPGKVTAGLARRTVRPCTVLTVNDLAGADEAAESISSMEFSRGE